MSGIFGGYFKAKLAELEVRRVNLPELWQLLKATEVLKRAAMADVTGRSPFVDTEAAARFLAHRPHSMECYRSLGCRPSLYKFGKSVRHAAADLEHWAIEWRYDQTEGENRRVDRPGAGKHSVQPDA